MIAYQEMSDAQLMHMVCNSNHDAFAVLVNRHTQNFFALAFRSVHNKADAEDIVQLAFIKLWQKPSIWDSDKSLFTTWFYRVVLNACHDHSRRKKHWFPAEPDFLDNVVTPIKSAQNGLEEKQELKQQQRCLEMALAELSTAQRDAINLVVYCGVPQKQAAKIMDVSLKALESLLVRAKRALHKSVAKMQLDTPPLLDQKNRIYNNIEGQPTTCQSK